MADVNLAGRHVMLAGTDPVASRAGGTSGSGGESRPPAGAVARLSRGLARQVPEKTGCRG